MMTKVRRRAWQVFLAFTAIVMVGYMLVPVAVREFAYPIWTTLAFVAMVVGLRRNRPHPMVPFTLITIGMFATAIGDWIFFYYPIILHQKTPYPSTADMAYLVSYGLWATAAFLLVRGRKGRSSAAGWIDTAIAITAFALVEFVFIIYPYLSSAGDPLLSRLVSAAFPISDIVMLGMVARLFVLPGRRVPAFHLLAFGFVAQLGVDSVYGVISINGTYGPGVVDLAWIAAYGLFAATMLHPSVRSLAAPTALDEAPQMTNSRLGILAGLALIAPALYAYTSGRALPITIAVAISAGTGLLFLLVIARLAGLVRALARSKREVEEAQALRGHLLRRTIRVSEYDRTRLAEELHDGPVQGLTALGYRLDSLQSRASRGSAPRDNKLGDAQDALSNQISSLRKMMMSLRPGSLIERGLEATLKEYCASILAGSSISCDIDVRLTERPAPEIEVMVCRVVEEAMSNVAKHSFARRIAITVTDDAESIDLSFNDDGVGLPSDASILEREALGIANMRERVEMMDGTFSITSDPGHGTSIRANVPKRQESEGAA